MPRYMLASRWLLLFGHLHGVGASECLVGCLVQGISPFDDENLAVWDDRSACDSTTVGCEVSAVMYPGRFFQGALWTSSLGADGSSGCTCDICDPYLGTVTTTYMSEETSLWSRIHCYLVASELSGYDVSPCVAAIVDTGVLPCVEDVYEAPTVDQFVCEENTLGDLSDSSSVEECTWDGEYRSVDEFYGRSRAPSPLQGPSSAPVSITSGTSVLDSPTPVPSNVLDATSQPELTSTDSPDPTPVTPSAASSVAPVTSQPGLISTVSPEPTPVPPSATSPPRADGSTLPLEEEGGEECAVGNTCSDGLCCHPDTHTCGRSESPPAMMREEVQHCLVA